mmetsp:Transcript_114998/g.247136  ORF Transcript_114998/g.247136 Transcript_114998/m.247136 type:complete len:214 (-) Transcript_114998:1050-1691(-)
MTERPMASRCILVSDHSSIFDFRLPFCFPSQLSQSSVVVTGSSHFSMMHALRGTESCPVTTSVGCMVKVAEGPGCPTSSTPYLVSETIRGPVSNIIPPGVVGAAVAVLLNIEAWRFRPGGVGDRPSTSSGMMISTWPSRWYFTCTTSGAATARYRPLAKCRRYTLVPPQVMAPPRSSVLAGSTIQRSLELVNLCFAAAASLSSLRLRRNGTGL